MEHALFMQLLGPVRAGQIEEVRKALEGQPREALVDDLCVVLMHEALIGGHPAMVDLLFEMAGGAAVRNAKNFTLLGFAVARQYIRLAEWLIARGADPRADGDAMLVMACSNWARYHGAAAGYRQIIELLLGRGADPNARTAEGETPILNARDDVRLLLLQKGADVRAAGKDGWTALHGVEDSQVAELLVKGGASVHARWNVTAPMRLGAFSKTPGQTPLHVVREKPAAEALLRHGADVNARDEKGATPVHYRAKYGPADTLRLLLKKGGDHRVQDSDGNMPLHLAGERNAQALLDAGADLTTLNKAGRPPLHEAFVAWSKSPDAWEKLALKAVEAFLDKGLDPNLRDAQGKTLLSCIVTLVKKPDVVQLLVQRGADVNAKDAAGDTALHEWAKGGDNAKVAGPLFDGGADTNAANSAGRTPLHAAIEGGAPFRVNLLLERGADPSRADASGRTPLDLAQADPETARLAPAIKKALKKRSGA